MAQQPSSFSPLPLKRQESRRRWMKEEGRRKKGLYFGIIIVYQLEGERREREDEISFVFSNGTGPGGERRREKMH